MTGGIDLGQEIDAPRPGLIALRRDALAVGVHIMSLAALDLLQ